MENIWEVLLIMGPLAVAYAALIVGSVVSNKISATEKGNRTARILRFVLPLAGLAIIAATIIFFFYNPFTKTFLLPEISKTTDLFSTVVFWGIAVGFAVFTFGYGFGDPFRKKRRRRR